MESDTDMIWKSSPSYHDLRVHSSLENQLDSFCFFGSDILNTCGNQLSYTNIPLEVMKDLHMLAFLGKEVFIWEMDTALLRPL